ncbi:MAG: carbohydrate kinase [Phaeodactylibacter sp.]|nr:carbohydrate kinase [Phaeodactylibacter sp.]
MSKPTIISYGELLWDVLPSGKLPGGAPMNVAYNLQQLGVQAGMISSLGKDAFGDSLRTFVMRKGLSAELVQQNDHYPTGTVYVKLDEKGSPSYEITMPVAWDFIQPSVKATEAVKMADAFVYGSLACRSETSRASLLDLIQQAQRRVFDVNLREPFYSKELLETLLQGAHIVKMNDEELEILSTWFVQAKEPLQQMAQVRDRFQLEVLIVTKGAKGSDLLDASGLHSVPIVPVQVQDTIGSGDAFLAGFLSKYFTGHEVAGALAFASKMGAFIASKKGAMPDYSRDEVD